MLGSPSAHSVKRIKFKQNNNNSMEMMLFASTLSSSFAVGWVHETHSILHLYKVIVKRIWPYIHLNHNNMFSCIKRKRYKFTYYYLTQKTNSFQFSLWCFPSIPSIRPYYLHTGFDRKISM